MTFNYKLIIKMFGTIAAIISIMMAPAFLIALAYQEYDVAMAFAKTMIPTLLIGAVVHVLVKPTTTAIKIRDGYLIAAVSWFFVSAIGAFPYTLSGVMPSYVDAYFESVSGFTTTGATIIDDLSNIPKGILFWRSFCNWLGGMGILVLTISLLPTLGIGGMKIASAEAPGPTIEKMSTRFADSAKILYMIYLTFTVLQFVMLLIGGMGVYDSLIHTLGCLGTGGLSNYSDGIAHFNSFYIEAVITIFSILASINFALFPLLFKGRWKAFLSDRELKIFLYILLGVSIVVALNLWISGTCDSFGKSLRYSLFHVISFMSTSGYTTTDYTLWPSFSQLLIFLVMLIGGCSASTCGGIKVIRVMIIFKLIVRGTYKRLHPNSVVPVRIGDKIIPSEVVTRISSFAILYFTVFVFSSLVLSLEDNDFITTMSAAAGALSNTGMGFGLLGPAGTYSIFNSGSRLFLSVLMIAGRLELFSIIMLLSPSFWRSK